MMLLQVAIWSVLFTIGIHDAKKNQIPNYWLLILISLSFIEWGISHSSLDILISKLAAGCLMFSISLLLYFIKAMSAGDVKLLGVIGFLVGLSQVQSVGYWIIIAAGGVGTFYALYNSIESPRMLGRANESKKLSNNLGNKIKHKDVLVNRMVMPFAPAVVIGLALHFYFI
ncbi:prepilin peptidase [Aliivibrio fischeri]|uniref:prepilin peptidase n=1 Tax=Aliivibrio fischeri TaxID=668 RepID=UPI00080E101D|nr:prepilin peptidase [Aliivibrio fischeri]OCH36901.1 hypothetical protein A6E02_07085 [Aliivibrio fischeri]OED56201.1 hypothetical protein BEI47_14425 [Aliivibrio fischeri]